MRIPAHIWHVRHEADTAVEWAVYGARAVYHEQALKGQARITQIIAELLHNLRKSA